MYVPNKCMPEHIRGHQDALEASKKSHNYHKTVNLCVLNLNNADRITLSRYVHQISAHQDDYASQLYLHK